MYAPVAALTGAQVLIWFAWFIVEIIIHCLDSDYNDGSWTQTLAEQSMHIFMYQGVILAGTLAALHLATSVKTRASRVSSFIVQAFGWLAWFYQLYFIINVFRDSNNSENFFCGNPATNPMGQFSTFQPISVCRLARAAAAFSVIHQFIQTFITIYALIAAIVPPHLEDGTRKEIIEEDDAEVDTVVSANPNAYQRTYHSISSLSKINLALVVVSLIGYAILMFSMIQVFRNRSITQFADPTVVNDTTGVISQTWNILGDFVVSWNFRQLSLSLALALGVSSYAAFRHNRGIQAGALFLTVITMMQWWSLIIQSGRYLRQYNTDNLALTGGDYVSKRAQDAMYAGMCIILAGETLRAPILLARYYQYIPVTRNNVIPTYVRGAFATANWIPCILFGLASIATFAWWIVEWVSQSDYGIFDDTPNRIPVVHVVTDTMFIFNTIFLAAVFITEFFSERTKTLASKQAALGVNVVVHCAWFLLVWPWAYATMHRSGFWQAGFGNYAAGAFWGNNPVTNPAGLAEDFGFCNSGVWGGLKCELAQAAGILAVITGGCYLFTALWQLARILSMLPTPGQVATVDGTVVDALPPTVGEQKSLGWLAWLTGLGVLIWALASIDYGSGIDGFIAYTFNQLPVVNNVAQDSYTLGTNFYGSLMPSPIYAYTYSVAFNYLVILGFAVWASNELAGNPVVANWHAWRMMVTGLTGLLLTFSIPMMIFACRYINWGYYALGSAGNAVAAGIIIATIGNLFWYACAVITQRSPLIALPAAINNTAQQLPGKDVGLQQVVVTDPHKVGNLPQNQLPAQHGAYTDRQHMETTVVTDHDNAVPASREYSTHNQQMVPPV